MNTKRLLALHYTSPPRIGGLELAAWELAAAASRNAEWNGVLISGTANSEHSNNGPQRICIPELSTDLKLNRNIFDEFRAGRLHDGIAEQAKRIEVRLNETIKTGDLLVSFNSFSLPFNIALTAALTSVLKKRTDFTHVTWSWDLAISDGQYNWDFKEKWPWSLMWNKCERTSYFACSSAVATEHARAINIAVSEISVVAGGVDPTRCLRLDNKTSGLCRRRNLMSAYPLLFMASKLSARKNIPKSLFVLRELLDTFPNCHLVIAGSDSPHDAKSDQIRNMVQSLITDLDLHRAVTIMKWEQEFGSDIQFENAMCLMSVCDGLLFTSREEGFLFPILEAGLHNIPIFAPACDSLSSWASSYAELYSVDSTPIQIAKIIKRCFEKAEHRKKSIIRTIYSWDSVFATHFASLIT